MVKTKIIDQRVLDNRKVILQTVNVTGDNGEELISNKIILPYLTDDELLARYRRIKPIVSIAKNNWYFYYYLKRYNVNMMRDRSYIRHVEEDIRERVDITGAKTIAEFPCYHPYDYTGIFKPTIAEILQQFPDDVLDEANAFYMTSLPKNIFDLNMQSNIMDAGCRQSTVKALILKK